MGSAGRLRSCARHMYNSIELNNRSPLPSPPPPQSRASQARVLARAGESTTSETNVLSGRDETSRAVFRSRLVSSRAQHYSKSLPGFACQYWKHERASILSGKGSPASQTFQRSFHTWQLTRCMPSSWFLLLCMVRGKHGGARLFATREAWLICNQMVCLLLLAGWRGKSRLENRDGRLSAE
jgi:hypothetical protein